MTGKPHCEWFEDWFNSPYYHILYKGRDQCEADTFLDKLISILKPEPKARFLDLACGKGRHSFYLSKKGFDVTGIDLSPSSIDCASVKENELLHFYVHDMRKLFRTNYFDFTLNLFTSFGYFANEHDDISTIQSVAKGLKENGTFVLDFMNSPKVIAGLVKDEKASVDGIDFHIRREVKDGFITKYISVLDKGKELNFKEQVKSLNLADFERYFASAQLKIVDLRGNYELEPFDEKNSNRLILIAKKE